MEIKYLLLNSSDLGSFMARSNVQGGVPDQLKTRIHSLVSTSSASAVDKLMEWLTAGQFKASERLNICFLCLSSQHVQGFEQGLQQTLERLNDSDLSARYSLLKEIDIKNQGKIFEPSSLNICRLEVRKSGKDQRLNQDLAFHIIHGSIEGFKEWRPAPNALIIFNCFADRIFQEYFSEETVSELINTWQGISFRDGTKAHLNGNFQAKRGSFELSDSGKAKILEPTSETKLNQLGYRQDNRFEASESSFDNQLLKREKMVGISTVPLQKGLFFESDKITSRPKNKAGQPQNVFSSAGLKKIELFDHSLENGRLSSNASKKASLIDWLNSHKKITPNLKQMIKEGDSKANETEKFPIKQPNTSELKHRIKMQNAVIIDLKRKLQIREELCKEYFDKIVSMEKELSKQTVKPSPKESEHVLKIDHESSQELLEEKHKSKSRGAEGSKYSGSRQSLKSKTPGTEQIPAERGNLYFIPKRYEGKPISRNSLLDISSMEGHRRQPSLFVQGSFHKNNGAKKESSKLELEYLQYKLSGAREYRKRGNKSMFILKE
jgi:hypothetical protein